MTADGQDINSDKHVVVIVEDDEAYRYALGRDFERHGLVTQGFADGNRALDYFDGGGRADVLLTDIRLPVGTPNGLSLALMTRRRRPHMPIVLTSGYDLEDAVAGDLGVLVSKNRGLGDVLKCVQDAIVRGGAGPK